MKRREFIAVVGAVTSWTTFAETAPVPLVGILSDENPGLAAQSLEPFAQGLRNLGYVEGQNVRLQRYSAAGGDKLPSLAAELVDLRPNVILAIGTPATRAVQAKTRTIPIVFARIADPIGLGLVHSLARPDENLTGVSLLATDLSTKWLELLVAMVPGARRIGVLWDPTFPAAGPQLEDIRTAAISLNLELVAAKTRHPNEFQSGVRTVGEQGTAAVIVLPCPLFAANATQLAQLMAQARLPAMFGRREHVEAGGLMSYGTNYADMYRRAAVLVDKILRGARPTDIPVEQPTKFEFVINLKTAKQLGLTVPQSLLARADEVIE